MKTLRWIACVPLAMLVSVLTCVAVRMVFPTISFGGGLNPIENALGLLPLVLAAILGNVAFATVGVWTAPSASRAVAFVFFGLTFCLSGGGIGIVIYQTPEFRAFWLTSSISFVMGAGLGLVASLRLQRRRHTLREFSADLTPRSAAR